MEGKEIIKLLDILIGGTEATGDSTADDIVETNLMKLIGVINWCLDGLANSSETRHRVEYSMRRIGERAFSEMCDINGWLQNRIEDD